MKADEKKVASEKEETNKTKGRRSLYRSSDDKVLAGVFGGLADYLDIDATILRIIGIILFFGMSGEFILFYIIAAIIIPESDKIVSKSNEKTKHELKTESDSNFLFGMILIVMGILFILQKYLRWFSFDHIWPFIIVGFGIYLIMRR